MTTPVTDVQVGIPAAVCACGHLASMHNPVHGQPAPVVVMDVIES